MIPQAFINEWRTFAPWLTEAQIEQDLILSRAIVEIFSEPLLAKSLAFRGGTALHKLFIQPAGRYSEDIDLVQINEGKIGKKKVSKKKPYHTSNYMVPKIGL